MTPPYPAEYWDRLTDRQRINDLVHKIAQRTGQTYPEAYATARSVIDAEGPGTYAERLERSGRIQEAVCALIQYHEAL
jgi:hypothetical protein